MEIIQRLAIYFLAVMTGLVVSILAAIACMFICAGSGFAAPFLTPAALTINIMFFAFGVTLAFRHGYHFILDQFNMNVEPIPIPTPLPVPIQPAQPPTNPLLRHFDQSIAESSVNRNIKLLSDEEIYAFEKKLEQKSDTEKENHKKTLEKYKSFIQDDKCGISLTPLSEIKHPVTIEGKSGLAPGGKTWFKTYEREDLRTWIQTKGIEAKEPLMNCALNHPNIRFYSGFPQWIYHVIALVRSILQPSASANIEVKEIPGPNRALTPNHRNASLTGYPLLFAPTPDAAPQHESPEQHVIAVQAK